MDSTKIGIPEDMESRAIKRTRDGLRYVTNLKVLMNLSTRCLTLSESEVKKELRKAMEELAQNIGADHAYLFYYDFANNTIHNSFEWCN